SSSRVTRFSSSAIPRSTERALSEKRSRLPRTRPGSSASNSSTASRSSRLLPRAAMRPRTPPLLPLLSAGACGGGLRRSPGVEQPGRRLCGEGRLGLLERQRARVEHRATLGLPRPAASRRPAVRILAFLLGEVLPPRVLGLALLPDSEQRRRDEDRGVGTRDDADDQREGEVLERRAAEDEEADDRQQRDERRGQRAPDRLPQRNVGDGRERRPAHERDVLADAVEDDDRVVDRI